MPIKSKEWYGKGHGKDKKWWRANQIELALREEGSGGGFFIIWHKTDRRCPKSKMPAGPHPHLGAGAVSATPLYSLPSYLLACKCFSPTSFLFIYLKTKSLAKLDLAFFFLWNWWITKKQKNHIFYLKKYFYILQHHQKINIIGLFSLEFQFEYFSIKILLIHKYLILLIFKLIKKLYIF